MNWFMKQVRMVPYKLRLKKAAKHFTREHNRWRNNYDCGAHLYDIITGGRLGRARKVWSDAVDEAVGFCMMHGLDPKVEFGLDPEEDDQE